MGRMEEMSATSPAHCRCFAFVLCGIPIDRLLAVLDHCHDGIIRPAPEAFLSITRARLNASKSPVGFSMRYSSWPQPDAGSGRGNARFLLFFTAIEGMYTHENEAYTPGILLVVEDLPAPRTQSTSCL